MTYLSGWPEQRPGRPLWLGNGLSRDITMRVCTILFVATSLFALRPAPVQSQWTAHSQAQAGRGETTAVAEYRFRRMHLMRPDLVVYPAVKSGRNC